MIKLQTAEIVVAVVVVRAEVTVAVTADQVIKMVVEVEPVPRKVKSVVVTSLIRKVANHPKEEIQVHFLTKTMIN